MTVSFPVKFRLLGPGQKVGTTDTENLSLFIRKGKKKKAFHLALHPFLHLPNGGSTVTQSCYERSAIMYFLRCGLGSGSVKCRL